MATIISDQEEAMKGLQLQIRDQEEEKAVMSREIAMLRQDLATERTSSEAVLVSLQDSSIKRKPTMQVGCQTDPIVDKAVHHLRLQVCNHYYG